MLRYAPMVRGIICCLAIILAWPSLAAAEETVRIERPDAEFVIGLRYWLSTGGTRESIAAPGGSPNVLSELKWKGMKSNVYELNGTAVIRDIAIFHAGGGFGTVGHGTLRDQDFLGNNRTGLFSDTISTADDNHLFYVQGDLGTRLASWQIPNGRRRSHIDALLGYQYWEEKYTATTTTDLFTGQVFSAGSPALFETYRWHSLRAGLDADVELFRGLSFHGKALFIPWSYLQVNDIHPLRTDLRHDPSFREHASGGYGGQLDGTLSYLVSKGLSLEAGYQWWYLKSGKGQATARPVSGPEASEPFNGAVSLRYGFIFGIRYDMGT